MRPDDDVDWRWIGHKNIDDIDDDCGGVVIMALMMMLTANGCSAFESTALSPFSISCLTAKLARLEGNWLPEMKDISYR